MKILPIFKTTLAKDMPPGPQGQPAHKAGSEVVISNEVKTEKLGNFLMITPNPVCFYLSIAEEEISKFKIFLDEVNLIDKKVAFPKQDGGLDVFRNLQKDELYKLFECAIKIPIFLYTALEAFSNQLIPEKYSYEIKRKGKKDRTLNREEIEQSISLKEKLSEILDRVYNVQLKKDILWQVLGDIKNLRDELIHLKTRSQSAVKAYNHIYSKLVETDFDKWLESTIGIIKFYKPEYFE